MALIVDALIITVAVFMIFHGAQRGLILSLGGFLSLVIAFFARAMRWIALRRT